MRAPSLDANKLVIVLWSCGPERPVLAAAPFVYALTARALEVSVDMHFTSTAVRWLLAGHADAAHTDEARTKSVRDFIREAKAAGARMYACSMALREHRRGEMLIPECDGQAGAAALIHDTLHERTRTLIF